MPILPGTVGEDDTIGHADISVDNIDCFPVEGQSDVGWECRPNFGMKSQVVTYVREVSDTGIDCFYNVEGLR